MTHRLANLMDSEVERLSRIGVRASNAAALRIRVGVIHAYRYGWDVGRVIRLEMDHLQRLVVDAMTASHMMGVRRSALNATHHAGRLVLADPFDSSMRFLEDRLNLSPGARRRIAEEYGKAAVSVTGKLSGKIEEAAQRLVKEARQQGLSTKQGVQYLRKGFNKLGITIDQPSSLETMYRTQTLTAYAAGRWKANKDPAIQEILWGYKYVTVGDDRVRPNHAALEGVQLPKEDPIWQKIWPPNGYNCRCQTIEIFDDGEVVDVPDTVEIDGMDVSPGPDNGWDFNPGEVLEEV